MKVLTWNHPDEFLLIGRFCSIASGVTFILGGNHHFKHLSNFSFKYFFEEGVDISDSNGPIIIKDGVWIGTGAIILSGVTIGKGAIIGAGAVVAKDIPPFAIAVGNPCKVVRYRFDEEICNKLVKLNYYKKIDRNFYFKYKNELNNPLTKSFIEKLEQLDQIEEK